MRRLLLTTLAAFLLMSGISLAADAAPEGAAPASSVVPPAKIGVVDMQTIAMDCDAAKEFMQQLESKYGKERSSLEKEGAAVKKQAEGLKNPKVSEEKKLAFIKAKQKLDQNTRNFARKIEQDQVKFRQEMVSLVFNATYEVARAKGFTFVVDVTAGGVLYADQSMDLTKEVMEEVNKLYKANKDKKTEAKPADNAKKNDKAAAPKK